MMPLVISEVHVHFIPPQRGLFALARIVLNGALVLEGIGVHQKRYEEGYRLTYPTRSLGNGQARTVFHPITPELSKAIEVAVFQRIDAIQKDVNFHDRHNTPQH